MGFFLRAGFTAAQAPEGDSDWVERSTAPGVLQAIKVESSGDVEDIVFDDGLSNAENVSYDTTQKASGSGSVRIEVLDDDGTNNGTLRIYIDPAETIFSEGDEFYIQWRQYMPTAFCQTAFPGSGGIDSGKANGIKQIIISQYSSSNVIGEIVVENTRQMSCPQMYWQWSGGDVQIYEPYASSYRLQNMIDNDPETPDPGEDLEYPESTQRYGPMYNHTPVQTGAPDDDNGGYVYLPNEWQTFMIHVRVGTWGDSNTLIEMWCAGEGDEPILVHRQTDSNPGQPPAGGYEAFWLLPYCTARTSNGGFDTYVNYDEIITSIYPINFPGGFTVEPYGALAAFVAAMEPNTWAEFPMNGLDTELIDFAGSVMTYTAKGVWDPVHRRVICSCGSHGSGEFAYTQKKLVWSEDTNTWTNSETPPVAGGVDVASHGYYQNAINQDTGDLYWHGYNNHTVKELLWGGSWTDTDTDDLGGDTYSVALDWNYAMGQLTAGNVSGITTWDQDTDTWTTRGLGATFGGSLILGYGGGGSAYNPVDGSTLFAGGANNGGNNANTSVVRMSSSGTCTQMSAAPVVVGVPSSDGDLAVILSGMAGKGPVLVGPGSGNCYRYNTGSDTWTSVSTRPFTAGDTIWWGCAIESYGCYFFVWNSGSVEPSDTAYIWKPPA